MNDWRTIAVEAPDGLRRETWKFHYLDSRSALILVYYGLDERKAQRFKWKSSQEWWNYRKGPFVPPLPASVRDEVLRRFRDAVTVVEPTEER